ncbi:unnamed protein product [Pieris brassicae]|uniref:Uncharacterized protein n=1 Tax=Pieris brassicae TaxID=7116 RepID=A0A9P0X7Q5_PIEBR|nr:unnamed protein product [Pieris brassicae]
MSVKNDYKAESLKIHKDTARYAALFACRTVIYHRTGNRTPCKMLRHAACMLLQYASQRRPQSGSLTRYSGLETARFVHVRLNALYSVVSKTFRVII